MKRVLSMTNPITFTIPHRLTRLNEYINSERRNRYIAAKIKKDMTDLCSHYIPKGNIDYEVSIHTIWTVKLLRNDLDNVAFGKKFILDAMTRKGLIKSDNLTVIKSLSDEYIKGKDEQVAVIVRRWNRGTN